MSLYLFKKAAGFFVCVFVLSGMFVTGAQSKERAHIKVKTRYYSVSGDTARDLRQAMWRRGPYIPSSGSKAWAKTNWTFVIRRPCRVFAKITYTYPRWSNKKKSSKRLQKRWDRMIRALKRHEERHGRDGIAAAHEMQRKNCKNTDRVEAKWLRRSVGFDRRTGFGTRRGVSLR